MDRTKLTLILTFLIAATAFAEEVSVFPFAGSAGGRGTRDGVGAAARFRTPRGVARAANGDLIVADAGANTIRRVTSTGMVTTIAGTPGVAGWTDGQPATFNFPEGVAVGADGSVLVTEQLNGSVRLIAPDGSVSTLARGLDRPTGVAVDAERRVYVAETMRNRIVRIANGATSTFAEVPSPFGVALASDGSLYVATLGGSIVHVSPAGLPTAIANNLGGLTGIALLGDVFLVTDRASHRVLRVSPNGDAYPIATWREGLYEPVGVVADARGGVWIADSYGGSIRAIGSSGELTTLAGMPAQWGNVDGAGPNARFTTPVAVAADRDGTLYVADSGNHAIRRITRGGVVSTMALTGLVEPSGVAVDASGRLFVADRNGVHRVDGGVLTTLTRMERPGALALDANGTLYIADPLNKSVKKISNGVVSTFAADLSQPGDVEVDASGNVWIADGANVLRVSADGHRTSVGSGLRAAGSLAIDARGNVWVADTAGHTLRKMNANGAVVAIGGRELAAGTENGVGRNAGFDSPASIATDAFGNVYVVEPGAHALRVAGVQGDANGDFVFDMNDLTLMSRHVHGENVSLGRFGDMNQDGALDEVDLAEMKKLIGVRQRPAGR